MDYKIISLLQSNLNNSNKNKSSYWQKYLNKKVNYEEIDKDLGFGSFTKKNYKKIIHYLLQKITFENYIFKTKSFKLYKNSFDKYLRQIDVNTIRHIFTFNLLSKNEINPKKICLIGDGKLNGLTGAHLHFPDAKIYSVNLTETLIHDYLILQRSNLDIRNSVSVVDDIKDRDFDTKLILVPSNNKDFLRNKNIDLFINIVSFQEMTVPEVENYFNIIKNNNSFFYCCNREEKKLPGGEILSFKNYPWGNGEKYFFENCPWHQKFYSLYYPFINNYDGNIIHSLVKY